VFAHLETLFYESDSVTKAISLYFMNHLDCQRAKQQAQQLLDSALVINPLVKETIQGILKEDTRNLGTVKKLLCLASCDLFKSLKIESLMELSYQAKTQEYGAYTLILEEGEQGLELLVLVQGEVEKSSAGKGETLEPILILNEVEILGKIPQTATLRAGDNSTCLISLESRLFEEFFSRDRDFARKLLETVITSGTRYDT
jgi:CRP-like cAMP-binding protein